MFEYIGLGLFALIVMGMVIKPFPFSFTGLLTCLLLIAGYFYFGNGLSLWHAHQTQVGMQRAKAVLETYKTKDAVISALKKKLDNTPQHAQGWYLLGRLYASQQRWVAASQAFQKAHAFKPMEKSYHVEYVMSVWERNQRQLSKDLKSQFTHLIKKYPDEPALYMVLALGAQNKKMAMRYWTQLLSLLDPNSDEAELIRQNIAVL